MPPIISIVGKSKSGKTTLLVKLIPELKKRGYKICTMKHAFHGFEMDKEGKDSFRHREAGADSVITVSPNEVSMISSNQSESIDDFAHLFSNADLVITEGFKRQDKPKIEIFRTAAHKAPLCLGDKTLVALVTDSDVSTNAPKMGLDEIEKLADLIEAKFLGGKK